MSLVLALDASTTACSACLWSDETGVVAHRFAVMARGQSEALMPMVAEIMEQAKAGFGDVTLIATSVGPGAFTGLRIGLAAARGLALAGGLPIAGITTTEAVAAAIPPVERQGRIILTILESKRRELYVQSFDEHLQALSQIESLVPEDIVGMGKMLVAGDAAAKVLPLLENAVAAFGPGQPDAAFIAPLAFRRWQAGTALPPTPLYLRPPDVTVKQK